MSVCVLLVFVPLEGWETKFKKRKRKRKRKERKKRENKGKQKKKDKNRGRKEKKKLTQHSANAHHGLKNWAGKGGLKPQCDAVG